jgi:hypothetical protein
MPPTAQRGEGAEAPVLFTLHRGDEHITAKLHPGAADGLHRPDRCDEPGLHVTGATTEDGSAGDARLERTDGPRGPVADRYDVDVAVEHQGGRIAAVRPGKPPDEPPRLAPRDLHAGKARIGEQRVEVEAPVIDVEPTRAEQCGDVGLGVVLGIGAADARDAHERCGLFDQLTGHRVHLGQHALDDRHGRDGMGGG